MCQLTTTYNSISRAFSALYLVGLYEMMKKAKHIFFFLYMKLLFIYLLVYLLYVWNNIQE